MTKKIKELPVTKTELQDAMKYIDVALGGRFRTMESRLEATYSPSKELTSNINTIIKGLKVITTLLLIIIGILISILFT